MESVIVNGPEKHKRIRVFIFGALLGAVAFLLIYGLKILDPSYDDWLLLGDMDLKQHYIGFCHFRMSRWQFPVGLTETLSYPESMSVIYTDSIPVLAVFFKLFAYFLPVKFQYFGFAGIISFMLMGGLSSLLIYRFCDNEAVCILYSLIFAVSYPIIQRMYYHTALAAQWIIILAFVLWLYQEELSIKKRILFWSLSGVICVSIHSYFLPMAGLILLAAAADEVLAAKKDGSAPAAAIKHGACELFGFCAGALASLFIYGGFYGGTSVVGDGLGTFSSNLNTFINPLDDGKLYDALPLYYDFQYEGFGYLGGGILFLLIADAVFVMLLSIKGVVSIKSIIKQHHRVFIACVLFFVSFALAVFPIVSINDVKLFGVPYPEFIRKVLGIFRSNGRFIWIAVYMLMLLAIASGYRLFYHCRFLRGPSGNGGKITTMGGVPFYVITTVAILLQFYDISGMLAGKHDYYANTQTYESPWISEAVIPDISRFSGFVFLYNDNDILMDTAYYAYQNGMWQNNYYYARDISEAVDMNIAQWREAIKSGIIRDDIIYILKEEDAPEELTEAMNTVKAFGHIIGTAGFY
ncbi:MAG: DUF6311 domain-containing protein [Lachnospiraceae bacterium]|nr:DUF6311 domain-containing protein [Lachnospiraceae bacterium]